MLLLFCLILIVICIIVFIYLLRKTNKSWEFTPEFVSKDITLLTQSPVSFVLDSLTEKERNIITNGYAVAHNSVLYYDPSKIRKHIVPFVPAKMKREGRIPNNIFQGFNHRVLDEKFHNTISWTLLQNPDFDYYFHDTYEQRGLIRDNFDEKVLKAYDTLIPGAYRSDLWRLCVLYVHGGIYMDLKLSVIESFNSFIDNNCDFVMAMEYPQSNGSNKSMLTSFMASVPKHPFLLACINAIVERVSSKEYGINEWDVTGPLLYASVFSKLYPVVPENIQLGIADWSERKVIIYNEKPCIKLRIPQTDSSSIFSDMVPEEPYSDLWHKKAIYREIQ